MRGARIETSESSRCLNNSSVAPCECAGRGLKHYNHQHELTITFVAPCECAGRGLKLLQLAHIQPLASRRPVRMRGARIET